MSLATVVMMLVGSALIAASFVDRTLSRTVVTALAIPVVLIMAWNVFVLWQIGEPRGHRWRPPSRLAVVVPRRIRLPLYLLMAACAAISVTAWWFGRSGIPGYDSARMAYVLRLGQRTTVVTYQEYRHALAVQQRWILGAVEAGLAQCLLVSLCHLWWRRPEQARDTS
ncbi:hypothetical protein AB0N05_11760 [Nocardia sp. NPDC051030]|uniref:hypothetical protein n=1 Tax=Nocardia sp. NPDC051030 TaxID=3155162 RepID=UPI00342A47BC